MTPLFSTEKKIMTRASVTVTVRLKQDKVYRTILKNV